MNNRLNIFIDEAGTSSPLNGQISSSLPFSDNFYIVSLLYVFDDDKYIYNNIKQLKELRSKYKTIEAIHYGPLIRREEPYFKNFSIDEIRKIYFRTAKIISNSPIHYSTIALDKRKVKTIEEFENYLINTFGNIYYSNSLFKGVKEIKVYYDNGQECICQFIKNGIYKYFLYHKSNIFNSKPKDYALLQFADFICTSKLIEIKRKYNKTSKTEKAVFDNPKRYKKYFKDMLEEHRIE